MNSIVIIEDNQDNYDLLCDSLEQDYDLEQARDGLEGLNKVRLMHPDIILMDMSLPEMDGWEVSRCLKADPEVADIPIIALTAHAMNGDRQRCIEAGCNDYMPKPVNLKELGEMITKYIDDSYCNGS